LLLLLLLQSHTPPVAATTVTAFAAHLKIWSNQKIFVNPVEDKLKK
jgi:hypothetical protein